MSTLAEEDPKRAISNALDRIDATITNAKRLIECVDDVTIVESISETFDDERAIIVRALECLHAGARS